MLIEKATNAQTQVQLIPYTGMVNPEHINQLNCIPIVQIMMIKRMIQFI